MIAIFRIVLLLCFVFSSTSSPASFTDNLKIDYLKNGLKVITVEDHKDPIITFQVWYRVGGRHEVPGKTGLAHLTEHMMFKGSKNFKKGEVSRLVAKNGGNENAFTSQDYTAYFQNFSRDKLNISLLVESDRMANLLIDPDEFLLERNVVMEERRSRVDDDPTSTVVEEMFSAAYKVHPYRNPTIGWMNDLKNLTHEDLSQWYETYYVPGNATILLVGDFNREEALTEIKKYFDDIPKRPDPPQMTIIEPEQLGERRVWVNKEAQLPFIFAGYKAPNIGSPDEFPLTVLQYILSSGKSSRLYKSLVYERQIAVYAGGSYDGLSKDPALFYFYAGVKPGVDVDTVENALYEELEKIKMSGITEMELQKAKNQIEAGFVMGQDSIFYKAMQIGRLDAAGVGPDYLDSYIDSVRQVTVNSIKDVAVKYFEKDQRTVGILVPVQKGGAK